MRVRDSIGLNLSPLFLRVMLGVTFMWAGAGKFLAEHTYTPEQAAILAQMGVIGDGSSVPVDPGAGEQSDGSDAAPQADESQPTAAALTGKRVLGLAIIIHHAANPGFDEDGAERMPLWPAQLATGKRPVYLAYAAGIVELVAGLAMIIGLFTRLGALSLAGVMGSAMWLTQIGPAVQAGGATLGFLPTWGAFETNALGQPVWMPLLWQFSLFAASLAVFFLGAGGLSLDRIIFGRGPAPARPASGEQDS